MCHSSSAASTAPRACKQIKHDVNLLVHTAIKINLPRRERRRVSFAALPVRGHQVETDRLIGEEPVRVKQNTTSVQLPIRMEIRVENSLKINKPRQHRLRGQRVDRHDPRELVRQRVGVRRDTR